MTEVNDLNAVLMYNFIFVYLGGGDLGLLAL